MKKILIITIILSSCTEILINDEQYNSIYLSGGGWIQFNGLDVQDHLNNDFTIQCWISGDTNTSIDAKALLTILNNNNEVVLGLFRDTSIPNAINIYLDNELVNTIQDNELNWSTAIFNLITISSNNDMIKFYVNKTEVYSTNTVDLNIDSSDLVFGGKVNSSQTIASNFWTGYIDEIRLWNKALSDSEIAFHIDNPTKLISSSGCYNDLGEIQDNYSNLTDCENDGNIWTGIYADEALGYLKGLWRFNYNNPQIQIYDESCIELNLDSGVSGNQESCEDINGVIYTLPGYSVEFSKFGI